MCGFEDHELPQFPSAPEQWMNAYDADGLKIDAVARAIIAICANFHESSQMPGRVSASNVLMDVAIRKMDEALDIAGHQQVLIYMGPLFATGDVHQWTIDHVIPVHQLKTLLYAATCHDEWHTMDANTKVDRILRIVHSFFWRAFIPKKLNSIVSGEYVEGRQDRKLDRWMPNLQWLTEAKARLDRYRLVASVEWTDFNLARLAKTPWDRPRLFLEANS